MRKALFHFVKLLSGLVTGKSIGPFVAAVFAVSLPGCVYVPPVWDINDEINTVSNMKEGVATREDVLDRLGEPNGNIEAHTFTYSGKDSSGYLMFCIYSSCSGGLLGEEYWTITISFDEGDFVESIRMKPDPLLEPEARKAAKAKAAQGDPEALYQLARSSVGNKRLERYCLAATGGLPIAQYHMGRHFETKAEADNPTAFFWHSLAAQGELPASQSALVRLTNWVSEDETASTLARLENWQPSSATCDELIEQERLLVERERLLAEQERLANLEAQEEREKIAATELDGTMLKQQEAAEQGSADDQYRLGRYHYDLTFDGPTSEQAHHASEAWYWVCRAANNGHPEAQSLLGFLYSNDNPDRPTAFIPKDLRKAYLWYSHAASNGRSEANAGKARLAESMATAKITEAQRLVAEWKPNPAECETARVVQGASR